MQVLMDYLVELNWLSVALGAVAAFAVGAIWYSDAAFGKAWMKGAGLTKKDTQSGNMGVIMGGGLILTFISAAALSVLLNVLALDGVVNGALLGALVAVGFVVSNKKMHMLFEQKPKDYMMITLLGDVVALSVMGAVLGAL